MSSAMPPPEPNTGVPGSPARAAELREGVWVARKAGERPWAPSEAWRWSISASEVAPTLATVRAALVAAGLPPSHAEDLHRHLAVPRWQLRAIRLAQRAAAIRAARDLIAPDARPSQAADALVKALRTYTALAVWEVERHLVELPATAYPRRVALHRILRLNGGELRGLGFRTILYALEAADGSG